MGPEVEGVMLEAISEELAKDRRKHNSEEPDYPRRPQFRPEELDEEGVECNQQ